MGRQASREYHRNRCRARRVVAVQFLGGACSKCRSTDDLEFHHVNRNEKSFSIGDNITKPWATLFPELQKCVLLCDACHRGEHRNRRHGTITMATHGKCTCDLCRAVKREYQQRWRAAKKEPAAQVN